MKKKILAAIAVVLFLSIAGCSGSGPLDSAGEDGDAIEMGTIWGDEGEVGLIDLDEDGDGVELGIDNCPEIANPDQADSDEDGVGDACEDNDPGKKSPDGGGGGETKCDFDAPTLSFTGETTREFGQYVDIALTVKGGSGNFRWNLLSDLPLGLVLERDDDKGAIKGFPGKADEFPIKISVRDMECKETSNEVSFTLTVKGQKVDIPTYHMVPVANSNPAEGMEPIQAHRFGIVKEIRVQTVTGSLTKAGTDADIQIKFCSHKDFANCDTEVYDLDDPDRDERETGTTDTNKIKGKWMRDELKYFTIWTDNSGKNAGWMLEGIKVEYIMEGGSKELAYWNPCVHKWLNGVFDHLYFGPDDVSICSVVETADVKDAGTDDKVYLIFPDYENNAIGWNGDYDYKEGPYFTNKFDFLAIKLGWDNGDDYERGDEGHYGDYSFDRDPFRSTDGKPTGVNVQKAKDSKKGGWYLHDILVVVFKPAQNFVYANDCKENGSCDAEIKGLMYYAKRRNLSEAEGWIQSSSSKGKREGLNLGSSPEEGMIEFKPRAEWVDSFTLDFFSNIGGHKS